MEHENCIGESSEWYTPPELLDALGCRFDLDPCSPGPNHWVPAARVLTAADDGLASKWKGFVFMNPPFGGRNGQVPWIEKFLSHGNGIGLVRAYTSAAWFHEHAIKADCFVFPRGKTKFVRPDGSIGKSPGAGIVLLGVGKAATAVLSKCGIGWFIAN